MVILSILLVLLWFVSAIDTIMKVNVDRLPRWQRRFVLVYVVIPAAITYVACKTWEGFWAAFREVTVDLPKDFRNYWKK